ncbi:cytochrome P450 3A56-like [Oratosquilla oratoria]|uniref:cytochrome P450 3A56-like n=1 Tax=Oratosquilla oratoria TaxID=337810 RepID=UPI003F76D63E
MMEPVWSLLRLWTRESTWLLLALALLLYAWNWIHQRRSHHRTFKDLGIPGPDPHIIYGNNHQLRKKGVVATDVMNQWKETYGDIFGFYVGWKPMMVILDLDKIKQILIKEFHNFANRPKFVIEAQPVMDTIVGLRDQRWKDVRSVLAPTFSMMKMKQMAGIMNRKVDTLLQIINNNKEEPIEFYSTYQGLTLDVISECALAMKTSCQWDQNNDPFFAAVRAFLKNAINPAILMALYFPIFGKLLSFISNRLALSGRMTQMIVSNVKTVISIRRKNLTQRNVDVLQLMLEAAESIHYEAEATTKSSPMPNPPKPTKKLLTDEEIIANAWVFMLGGFETTASTLTYTTYLLATHPEVQEKAYKEISSSLGKSVDTVSYDQIMKLPYLDKVFSESLRMYPPIVTFITREAAKDIEIDGLFIPKDMSVMIPVWQIHRDNRYWDEPDVFNPERFDPENKDRHPMAYIPFGAGPRNCIGMRFAQLEAKVAMVRLMLHYRFEACSKTPVPLTFEIPTVAINPSTGVFIRVVPRE